MTKRAGDRTLLDLLLKANGLDMGLSELSDPPKRRKGVPRQYPALGGQQLQQEGGRRRGEGGGGWRGGRAGSDGGTMKFRNA